MFPSPPKLFPSDLPTRNTWIILCSQNKLRVAWSQSARTYGLQEGHCKETKQLIICIKGRCVTNTVAEIGLFGVSRHGVADINLTSVEPNLVGGVPSEAPNMSATSLPHLTLALGNHDPFLQKRSWAPKFLLNGDEAIDPHHGALQSMP
jgi:hypothetical protein